MWRIVIVFGQNMWCLLEAKHWLPRRRSNPLNGPFVFGQHVSWINLRFSTVSPFIFFSFSFFSPSRFLCTTPQIFKAIPQFVLPLDLITTLLVSNFLLWPFCKVLIYFFEFYLSILICHMLFFPLWSSFFWFLIFFFGKLDF